MLFRILIPPHRSNIAIKCNLILYEIKVFLPEYLTYCKLIGVHNTRGLARPW